MTTTISNILAIVMPNENTMKIHSDVNETPADRFFFFFVIVQLNENYKKKNNII